MQPVTHNQPPHVFGKSICALAKILNLGDVLEAKRVKTENDIDRIVTSKGVFFCKTYTKTWYGSPQKNSYPVLHESGAYATLRQHGLKTPEVICAASDDSNPLGMPFLLLRGLEGETIGQALAAGQDVAPLFSEAARYLKAMHNIHFRFPGFVTSPDGPPKVPDANAWRHRTWVVDALEKEAKGHWDQASVGLGPSLRQSLEERFDKLRPALEKEYEPPRMIHGDCHVDQFFFLDGEVTGVVDMEVASAGDPIADIIKFAIEAASKLAGVPWWEPFFSGYGTRPDFDTFQLRLLCCEHLEFRCQDWRGTYPEIIARLSAARTWPELFACTGKR